MKAVRIARTRTLAGAAAVGVMILAGPLSLPARAQFPIDLSGPQCIRWQKKKSLATFTQNQVIADAVTLESGTTLPPGHGEYLLRPQTRTLLLRTFHQSPADETFYVVEAMLTQVSGMSFRGPAVVARYLSAHDYMVGNPAMAIEKIEIAVEKVER